MDRYNDVKILLKTWEQSFVQENQRKPNKVLYLPKLYKEYRTLKQAKENGSNGHTDPTPTAQTQSSEKESDCWGTHLNRKSMPVAAPKLTLTPKDKESLQASAQYFGMKLKSNLGALTKERPVSLKKSFTPRRTPLKSWKDGQSPNPAAGAAGSDTLLSPLLKPANTRPHLLACPVQTGTEHPHQPFEPIPAFTPSKLWSPAAGASSSDRPAGSRAQQLRQTFTKRLSSVDSSWLERCQVFDEVGVAEKPVVGNLSLAVVSAVDSPQNEGTTLLGERASKSTMPQALPFSDEQQPKIGCGVTSAAVPASLRSTGQHSSLGSGSGEGKDGETRPGLRGQAEGGTSEETAIGASTAKKSRARARKGRVGRVEEEAEVSTQPPQKAEGDELGTEKKGTKKKAKKRQRDLDTDGETPDDTEKEGAVKKRRTKKVTEATLDGRSPKKVPRVRKKKAQTGDGNASEQGSGDVTEKEAVKQKPRLPQENLLGEVDEEDVKASLPRKTVRVYMISEHFILFFSLFQLTMEKFQLKGERFGGPDSRGGFGGFNRPGDPCFKCGGTGHWAMNCKGRVGAPADSAAADDASAVEEPFELPTLEEVARATGTLRSEPREENEGLGEKQQQEDGGDEVLLNVIRPDYERLLPPPPMQPLYPLGEDGKVQAVPSEVNEALKDFGYKSFRPGQEQAIMRILSGLSTLVVLSTGMGKSLCYQLPAYLYAQRSNCITLVVSPLVSLMDDQLSGLPSKLKAAAIHSNMSKKQREVAIEKVKAGEVHVLLLSPEALVGGGHSGPGCLPPADQLPPVAFACIDEAHCVSEWSHNFRPCYLRLCKVLRDRLGVRCLLGLTATATLSTALDIAQNLGITDQDGVAVRSAAVPNNLQLSVSMDRDKDQALVCLLKGERFGSLESVIIYCTRREETTRISALLRTCLQGVLLKESNRTASQEADDNPVGKKKKALARKKIRKPLKWMAESYHAGMSSSERRRVQNNFMCGELRVVVATVAFGMGLDKSDVRGIVHYNMPKSFESYVQEIGRAGRDGEPAHCHLFLDPEGGDLHELRRHIYANTVDYYTVKKIVQKVFPPCRCRQIHQNQQDLARVMLDVSTFQPLDGEQKHPSESSVPFPQRGEHEEEEQTGGGDDWPTTRVCHTHERAISMQDTVEALDITEEGLETLLCYLELHPQQWVELLHPTLSNCKMVCYNGPHQLRKLTKICPPVAVVLARKRLAGERVETCDSVDFDVVEVADTMGWQLGLVKRGLRQLQWATNRGVLVEFSNLSFYFRSYGDLTPDEMDRVCEFLHGRVVAQERTKLYQLKACFKAFRSVAFKSCSFCTDKLDESRSLKLKGLLGDYFDKRRELDLSRKFQEEKDGEDEEELLLKCKVRLADIQSFLGNRSDEKFSGRAVARIFFGIGSPCYPAQTFGRDKRYWRKYIQFDFNEIIRFAIQEIIRFK
uniref:DNA 3'-5' helicase n=1 Tax=Oncorhynchus mykiss TaxID=8022 RepID=A0A8C7PRQ0_ONCMY